MTENGKPPEKPASAKEEETPSAPRSVRDTLAGRPQHGREKSSSRGRSRGKRPSRPTPVNGPDGPTEAGDPNPQAPRITTRFRTLAMDGEVWNVEVDGSSYIGGGSHLPARLLSLIFKSSEEVPTIRGPVFAVAQDLSELSEEVLRRLLEDSRDALGSMKSAMKGKDMSRGRRPRRSRG